MKQVNTTIQKVTKTVQTKTDECVQFYLDCGIISLCDVRVLTEEALMQKILKEVHPYAIFYDKKRERFVTYVVDRTRPNSRKQVCRKEICDLASFLISYYQRHSSSNYTFRGLYKELMEYESTFKSESTITAYIKSYKKHYRDDKIIDESLEDIKPIDMEIWLKRHIEEYKMDYKAYSKMAVLFSEMYKYANRKEYISKNPFDKIDVRQLGLYPSKKKKSEERVFSKNEIKDVYKIAFDDFKRKPYPVPLAIILIFQTGMRIGEIVALKWEDVNWEDKTLHICRYEENYQTPSADFEDLTKCKKRINENYLKKRHEPRDVDLTDDAIYVLGLLKDYYEKEGIDSEWLFYSNFTHDKCHNRAIDIRIRKYCKEAGLKYEKSTHKIRGTYISVLRDAGMSFARISENVGHKQLTTTINSYVADVNDREENMKILNNSALKLS